MRARELISRASSSRPEAVLMRATEGAEIVVGTTKDDTNIEVAGSGKPDPPDC